MCMWVQAFEEARDIRCSWARVTVSWWPDMGADDWPGVLCKCGIHCYGPVPIATCKVISPRNLSLNLHSNKPLILHWFHLGRAIEPPPHRWSLCLCIIPSLSACLRGAHTQAVCPLMREMGCVLDTVLAHFMPFKLYYWSDYFPSFLLPDPESFCLKFGRFGNTWKEHSAYSTK